VGLLPPGDSGMIRLTRLNQSEIIINSDLIEHVEIGANTVVTLSDGNSFVVKESAEELVDRVVQFKRRIHEGRGTVVIERIAE
jgi:flagellar protein FlbD